jgi:hypothetical protein
MHAPIADELNQAIRRTRLWYTKVAHADPVLMCLSLAVIVAIIAGLAFVLLLVILDVSRTNL